MKNLIKTLLNKILTISKLKKVQLDVGRYAPGAYYSPIPSKEDVQSHCLNSHDCNVFDIDLRPESQFELLQKFEKYYSQFPYLLDGVEGLRFTLSQNWFRHSDAIMLYSFLRYFKPRRIIEVGCGFSSAVILDTLELYGSGETSITFIDPNPERLNSILKNEDRKRSTVISKKVQEVELNIFQELKSGDLLFIDSSHVVKLGSDLHHLFFKIIPNLPIGVHLHFHDVFYPFEYPVKWLKQGRYWNEIYMLRAFLAGNKAWEMTMFNDFVNKEFGEFITAKMSACQEDFGGSLYLTRVAE